MDVTDRALYILQQHQIVCTWKETLAIKLSDGLYHEAASSYLKSYNPDNELKTNLPRVIHAGDYLACRSEYDAWKREQKSCFLFLSILKSNCSYVDALYLRFTI